MQIPEIRNAPTIIALSVITIAILALLGAIILRGGINENAPSLVALISFLGLLITALINTLMTAEVRSKVNGHLAAHTQPGHTDEEIQRIVQAVLDGQAKPAVPREKPNA